MVQPHQHGIASGPSNCRTGYRSPQDQRPSRAVTTVAQPATGTDPVILAITHHGTRHFVVDTLNETLRNGSQLGYTDGPFACRS